MPPFQERARVAGWIEDPSWLNSTEEANSGARGLPCKAVTSAIAGPRGPGYPALANDVKKACFDVLRTQSALEAAEAAIKLYRELDRVTEEYPPETGRPEISRVGSQNRQP